MKLFGNEMKPNAKAQITLALCTVLAVSLPSLRAQDPGAPGAGKGAQTARVTDEQFIRAAAKSGFLEVRLAKMGVQKAQNASVKTLAQRIEDDYIKINEELKKLASSKGITVRDAGGISRTTPPTDAERAQAREKAEEAHPLLAEAVEKLEGMSGSEFDRVFVQTTANGRTVKAFEKASQNATDPEVKAFAAKTLPTLKEHMTMAQGLQAEVGAPGEGAESKTDNADPSKK